MKPNHDKTIKAAFDRWIWIRFFMAGYVLLAVIGQIFYGNVWFSFFFGLTIVFFTDRYKRHLAIKRKNLMRNQFGDLLYALSASVATGRQLRIALQDAYVNLGYMYNANTPLMEELKMMNKSMTENREREQIILTGFAERSGVPDIQSFVDVYLSCRQAGSDLNQVIANASQVLMEKMSIEREIRVMTSQKQFEGKIISAMPILVILFLNLSSPGYLDVMYQTGFGRLIMTMALIGIFFAYLLTEKITNIEG